MLKDTINNELFRNPDFWRQSGELFLFEGHFFLRNFHFSSRNFLMPTQPYKLQEARVVLVKKGHAHYKFNLTDQHFEAGDLVVFLSDTLVEKEGISGDFEFDAFSFDATPGEPFIHLRLNEQTRPIVEQHMSLLWDIVHEAPYPRDNVQLLTQSLMHYIRQHIGLRIVNRPLSRREDTVRRFLNLVSQYATQERNIPFYANQLCIEHHYLSTLIKQVSGKTAMQWINQTAIKEIKVWLAYSDENIAQISSRMHFSCPASLSKFFKRETGMTPMEYREMRPIDSER